MIDKTIFTIGGRGYILLHLMYNQFRDRNSPEKMMQYLQKSHKDLVSILANKGINYRDLKYALVPNIKRKEIALFFDTSRIDDISYGRLVHEKILPLHNKKSTHSILDGDFIGAGESIEDEQLMYRIFKENVKLIRNVRYLYSHQFYIIYINNLTNHMFELYKNSLKDFDPYIGYADMTFTSILKLFLAFTLGQAYVKHKDIILMGHESEYSNDENIAHYDLSFTSNGFIYRSLKDDYYHTFLSYKIEAPALLGIDIEISLNAISTHPALLDGFEINIEPKKFQHLLEKKLGSIKRIGALDQQSLAEAITKKIKSNYIFNLRHTKHSKKNTILFNTILEFHSPEIDTPKRLMLSFEYLPLQKTIRLVTLY